MMSFKYCKKCFHISKIALKINRDLCFFLFLLIFQIKKLNPVELNSFIYFIKHIGQGWSILITFLKIHFQSNYIYSIN